LAVLTSQFWLRISLPHASLLICNVLAFFIFHEPATVLGIQYTLHGHLQNSFDSVPFDDEMVMFHARDVDGFLERVRGEKPSPY